MPRSVTLSFELLETFVALIRGGGNAAVAMQRLGLNQPTLSKRLKYLQHAGLLLDRPWLVRQGKHWERTEEGRRIWPAVEALVDRYEDLRAFLEGDQTRPADVHFACGQQMAAGLIRQALRVFQEQHPEAQLRISTLRGRARIEGVSNGSLDLAIVTHDAPAILELARRPLHIEPLASHRLVLACSRDSPWNRALRALPREGVAAEALAPFPLILPEPDAGLRQGLDEALRRRGVLGKLTIALEVGGWATILAYVRDGFGVGVLSEGAIEENRSLTVRPLDPECFPTIEAKLICRRLGGSGEDLDLSAPAQAWREVLRRTARPHGSLPG
jgi:DNA-binding transcriptional LysR family regulator